MDCTPEQVHLRTRRSVFRRGRSVRRVLIWTGLGLSLLLLSGRSTALAEDEPPAADSPPAIDYIVLDPEAETAAPDAHGPNSAAPPAPAHPATATDARSDADGLSGSAAGSADAAAHSAESGTGAAHEADVHSDDRTAAPSPSDPARAADHSHKDPSHQVESGAPVPVPADNGGAPAATGKHIVPAAWELLDPPYSHPSPLPVSGKAMYYNPGVMDIVIDSRLKFDHIEPCQLCIGYVAMLRSGDLNRTVWLQINDRQVEGPFHVVDAAATKHVGMLLDRGWIVDVDYRTAARWNFRMPYVTVWERPPAHLLLATDTLPLAWNASLLPAPVFKALPNSISLPDSALENQALRVKEAIDKRHKGRVSFVDLLEAPDEVYVK